MQLAYVDFLSLPNAGALLLVGQSSHGFGFVVIKQWVRVKGGGVAQV